MTGLAGLRAPHRVRADPGSCRCPRPLLPSALMSPLFSSAAMREILSDNARLNRMLRAEAALAAAEASIGVIPKGAAKPIAEACQAKFYDIGALGLAAVSAGNLAIPAGQSADRRSREEGCRGRALRALGRDQPGHHRYRFGARIARGDRRPHSPNSIARSPPSPRSPRSTGTRRRSGAPGCSRLCRCRSD